MNKRLRPTITLSCLFLLFVATVGLLLWKAKRQYALNRQLIAALVHHDSKQALNLVNAGANPNTRYTPSPEPTLKFLWKQWLHRVPVPADDSPTAFMFACGTRYFLTYEEGVPLTALVEDLPLLRAMLLHKANVHLRAVDNESLNGDNSTPLHIAAKLGRLNTVELLLQHGADINAQDETGSTPLMLTMRGVHTDIARLLLSHGANVNAVDQQGNTPLMWAVVYNNPALVRLLLNNSAKVNSQNDEGETPLHVAVRDGEHGYDQEIVRQLLACGADPSLPSKAGNTALDIVQAHGRTNLLVLLQHDTKKPMRNNK